MAISDKQVAPLLGMLTTDLPGCSTADKLAALERALREFLTRSRCWRETLTVIIPPCEHEAPLPWPRDAYAIYVGVVSINGGPFTRHGRFPPPLLIIPSSERNGAQAVDFECELSREKPAEVKLIGTLVSPRGCIDVPDWIMDRYGEAIADGAHMMLKKHARKPYTDLAGATECERGFVRGIADACCDGVRREREMLAT